MHVIASVIAANTINLKVYYGDFLSAFYTIKYHILTYLIMRTVSIIAQHRGKIY